MSTKTSKRSRYVRRPRVGEIIEYRTGPAEVLAVHENGRRLLLVDRLYREWDAERARDGWWLRHQEPEVASAETPITDAMLAHVRRAADESWLPQTVYGWEGGFSEGESCALVSAAAPLAAHQTYDATRPPSGVGQPILTVLPRFYYGSVSR